MGIVYLIYFNLFVSSSIYIHVASRGKALKEEWISYICHEVLNVSFPVHGDRYIIFLEAYPSLCV